MSPPVLYRLNELERKARGTTLANARVATIERDIASLRALLEAGGNPADLEAALNTLEVRVSALEGGFEEVVTMATSNREEVTRAHARITSLEGVVGALRRADSTPATPSWVWAVAAIAGLIAGLWWHLRNWSSMLGQSEVRSAADWWGSALIFGAGIALVGAALSASLASRRRPEGTSPMPAPPARTEPVPVEHPTRDARV